MYKSLNFNVILYVNYINIQAKSIKISIKSFFNEFNANEDY